MIVLYATLNHWIPFVGPGDQIGDAKQFVNGWVQFDITESAEVTIVVRDYTGAAVVIADPRKVEPGDWVGLDKSNFVIQ